MAISKLWASRLRSISVEFPPQNAPGGISLTRRWTWSVLLADFSSFPCLCPHHHPHYRHSSSSSHIPSSLSKTIVNPIVTIVSPVFCVSAPKKNEPRKRKENLFLRPQRQKKEVSVCVPALFCLLPFSQSSIAIFYIFILFALKNNHVSVLFRETRLVSFATSSSSKQQTLVLVVVLCYFCVGLLWGFVIYCKARIMSGSQQRSPYNSNPSPNLPYHRSSFSPTEQQHRPHQVPFSPGLHASPHHPPPTTGHPTALPPLASTYGTRSGYYDPVDRSGDMNSNNWAYQNSRYDRRPSTQSQPVSKF